MDAYGGYDATLAHARDDAGTTSRRNSPCNSVVAIRWARANLAHTVVEEKTAAFTC